MIRLLPLFCVIALLISCADNPTSPPPDPTATPQPTATATPSIPLSVYIKTVVKSGTPDESVTLHNNSGQQKDIGSWTLGDKNDPTAKTFQGGTTLTVGQEMIITKNSLGFQVNDTNEILYLKDSIGTLIHQWEDVPDASVPNSLYIYHVTASPTDQEQITIKNNYPTDKDISQWTLGDKNDPTAYTFPASTTIAVDAIMTINRSTLGFQINNTSEILYLKDSIGTLIDDWSN